MSNDTDFVTMSGDQVTLADLAGIDLEGIEERRQLVFPVGSYMWEVIADPEPPMLANLKGKGAVSFSLKCTNVIDVKDPKEAPNGNPMALIGRNHRETFFLTTMESLGYLKAFMVDIGGQGKGALSALLLSTVGIQFSAPIVHRPNADDKNAPPYVNINRNKIVPILKAAA